MPEVQQLLTERFGDAVKRTVFRDNVRYVVPVGRLIEVMTALKAAGFDYVADVAGIGYLNYPDATDRYGGGYSPGKTETAGRGDGEGVGNHPPPVGPAGYPPLKGSGRRGGG